MLILFSKTETLDLPDLYVKDAESGVAVPVAGVYGWDDDFLQTQTLTYSPLTFSDVSEFTSDGATSVFFCKRLSKLLASLSFSDSGASVDIIPVFYDSNTVPVIGKSVTITATLEQNTSSQYMAELEEWPLNGASAIKLLIRNISAGTVYVRTAGV